jgi:UDP-glucose 4-epimerase
MTNLVTLVTGGAGFIGSHLVAHLSRQGHNVIVIDDLSTGKLRNLESLDVDVELIQADIADPLTLMPLLPRQVETIYHLASQADVPLSVRQPVADFNTNMRGTLNVLEFAREHGSRVVFTSTVAVYAKDSIKPISEDAPIRASSPYGAAKIGGENYCYAYANCYGVNTVVARLFNVYGPLMAKYVIHDFVHKLQANPKVLTIIGSGNQVRDYTYVDDAVCALVLLAERGESGVAYNLGSGIPTRIRDLAHMIGEQMAQGNVELVCTNQEAVGDIAEWYADVTRLRSLGYKPQVSFRDGLQRTVQFILETL